MPATLTTDAVPETPLGELRVSKRAISPNNDGFSDNTTFDFEVGVDDKWWLMLVDEYTESVWEQSGSGSPATGITWDGITTAGNLVPDGDYEVQLYVLDAQGTPHLRDREKITVDLIPATLEVFKKASTTIGIKILDINPVAHWKFELFDTDDVLVEQMEADGVPPTEVVLSSLQGQPLAPYTCKLRVQDIAGNQSVQQVQLHLGEEQQAVLGAEHPSTGDPQPKLTLMVGSFVEPFFAKQMEAQLRHQNPYQKVAIYTATVEGKTRHRVTIGEFSEREDAAGLRQRIQETLGVEPVLITVQ